MSRHYYDDEHFDYQKYWRGRKYEFLCEKDVLISFFEKVERTTPLSKAELLDIGAGFGRLAQFYLPLVQKAVLLEPAIQLRRAARKRLERVSNYRLRGETIEGVNFKGKKFGIVLIVRVLHHIASPRAVFHKISKLVEPGGFLIVEFPNKLHIKNLWRLAWAGKLKEIFSREREDRRSAESIKRKTIPFFNYHPFWITEQLQKEGLVVLEKVSVSNCRSLFFKKALSLKTLLFIERKLRPLFSRLNLGPSIFLLCQKPSP